MKKDIVMEDNPAYEHVMEVVMEEEWAKDDKDYI